MPTTAVRQRRLDQDRQGLCKKWARIIKETDDEEGDCRQNEISDDNAVEGDELVNSMLAHGAGLSGRAKAPSRGRPLAAVGEPQHPLGLVALAGELGPQLFFGRQVQLVASGQNLLVVFGQGNLDHGVVLV